MLCTITLFFIIKFDDIRATTRLDTLIEIVIARFDTLIEIVIARFNALIKIVIIEFGALIKIVIVESASLISNKVAITNTIANKAITNIVTILLKTRLI